MQLFILHIDWDYKQITWVDKKKKHIDIYTYTYLACLICVFDNHSLEIQFKIFDNSGEKYFVVPVCKTFALNMYRPMLQNPGIPDHVKSTLYQLTLVWFVCGSPLVHTQWFLKARHLEEHLSSWLASCWYILSLAFSRTSPFHLIWDLRNAYACCCAVD